MKVGDLQRESLLHPTLKSDLSMHCAVGPRRCLEPLEVCLWVRINGIILRGAGSAGKATRLVRPQAWMRGTRVPGSRGRGQWQGRRRHHLTTPSNVRCAELERQKK
jgi:hypothetical protein